jgi:hypothetical protein
MPIWCQLAIIESVVGTALHSLVSTAILLNAWYVTLCSGITIRFEYFRSVTESVLVGGVRNWDSYVC